MPQPLQEIEGFSLKEPKGAPEEKNSNPAYNDNLETSPERRGFEGSELAPRKDRRALERQRTKKGGKGWRTAYQIPEKVRRVEKERRPGDEMLDYDGFKLPGTHHGKQRASCGQLILFRCTGETCPGRKVARDSCMKLCCPHCWKDGATRATKRIVRKKLIPYIQWRELHMRKAVRKTADPSHLVVSPPPEWWGMSIKKIRQKATEYAKAVGMEAAVSFVHPWRAKVDEFGRVAWYEEPHVHFVSFGWIWSGNRDDKRNERIPDEMETTNEVHERTGWVIKNGKPMHSEAELYEVIWYNISHCAVLPGSTSYHFLGDLAQFRGKEIKNEYHKCLCCGSIMRHHDADREWMLYGKDPPGEAGFFIETSGTWIKIQDEDSLRHWTKNDPDQFTPNEMRLAGIRLKYFRRN